MSPHLLGVFYGMLSAIAWGGGDFSGGLASQGRNSVQVLVLASLAGLVILLALAGIAGERFPAPPDIAWSAAAGLAGAVGLASVYRALALGKAALVAPLGAVIGAALPVLFNLLAAGRPPATQSAGFLVGIVGIWLVARSAGGARGENRPGLVLAVIAGLGFGAFFILLAQVEGEARFTPLLISRGATLLAALAILLLTRAGRPSLRGGRVALLAGTLDTGGNLFFYLASQSTRLDVAAVLSSLYPAMTVVLARTVSGEAVSRTQWAGVGLCAAAIGLIAL